MFEQHNYKIEESEEDYVVGGARGLRSPKSDYSATSPSYNLGRKFYSSASNFMMQGFRGEYK